MGGGGGGVQGQPGDGCAPELWVDDGEGVISAPHATRPTGVVSRHRVVSDILLEERLAVRL